MLRGVHHAASCAAQGTGDCTAGYTLQLLVLCCIPLCAAVPWPAWQHERHVTRRCFSAPWWWDEIICHSLAISTQAADAPVLTLCRQHWPPLWIYRSNTAHEACTAQMIRRIGVFCHHASIKHAPPRLNPQPQLHRRQSVCSASIVCRRGTRQPQPRTVAICYMHAEPLSAAARVAGGGAGVLDGHLHHPAGPAAPGAGGTEGLVRGKQLPLWLATAPRMYGLTCAQATATGGSDPALAAG
jgi:hypothetical protein